MCCTRAIALAACLALGAGCTIVRTYTGNEVVPLATAAQAIVAGKTTMAEVLRDVGPPDRLVRQYEGDVFVYSYHRMNENKLELEEPVFTHLNIFTYEKSQERDDRMVVLFDRDGIVKGVGFRRGTEQLEPFWSVGR